ncbi:hypothetical protein A2159_00080 [Candidatus Woesebacteria bacterium RBG_13_34_9]|uniref:DNA 3'-5' helicase n=1 Tax=Candidatus Woesebacteria bacterium RBG_13_34_9 TaxID=1802477 RepID=A0A1F7X3F5_9BACT|nr:MAG: hypothetical protein A2159_00080 [Candidatus Woesebacteria bacterium RBG_13_34_9]
MTDKLLSGLNPQQKKAVAYEGGPLLVLAGAGSGKTRVLTFRVAWFIHQNKVENNNVLLLTFTNKAAGEMKERVIKLTQKTPGFAGTFHSFCVRVLRTSARAINIEPNFVIYDEEDTKDAIKQAMEKANISSENLNPSFISSQISEAKNQMISPLQFAEFAATDIQEKIFKIWNLYEKLLQENQALDFDDLLIKTVNLFDEHKNILEVWQDRFTHIFVDEWQDTNKVQYKLTKQIVGETKNLTAVGDAAQSIYSWRGADYRNINYLIKDYPDIKVINLEQNYRSTQNILNAANSIIKKNVNHPILNLWTNKDEGQKIRIYRAQSELDEASFIISEIDNLITKGYEFSEIVILYRTNAQSRVLEEAFLHAGIPYILVGGVKFYSRREIKDVLSFLRLIVNPKDSVSKKRVEKLGKRQLEKFRGFVKNLPEKWSDKLTTLDLMDNVVEETKYLDKYKRESEENLARLENIKELRSVATEFPTINEFLENVALIEAEQDELGKVHATSYQLPAKNNKVTLMTLHAAKGLEFSIVFIVGMEEGLFPHSRSLFDIDELEEERRLAYVGITRAKDILYLTYAGRRLFFGQRTSNPPSRFIIDIPEDLLEGVENSYISFDSKDKFNSDFDKEIDDSINF